MIKKSRVNITYITWKKSVCLASFSITRGQPCTPTKQRHFYHKVPYCLTGACTSTLSGPKMNDKNERNGSGNLKNNTGVNCNILVSIQRTTKHFPPFLFTSSFLYFMKQANTMHALLPIPDLQCTYTDLPSLKCRFINSAPATFKI